MVDVIRQIGVSGVTIIGGARSSVGLKTEQVKRLKDLELENSRLPKAVSDLTLDKLILQETAREILSPRTSADCPGPAGLVDAADFPAPAVDGVTAVLVDLGAEPGRAQREGHQFIARKRRRQKIPTSSSKAAGTS